MSCCRSNSIGKGFCWLFLILLCVGLVVINARAGEVNSVQITGVDAEGVWNVASDRRSGFDAGARGHALVFDGC